MGACSGSRNGQVKRMCGGAVPAACCPPTAGAETTPQGSTSARGARGRSRLVPGPLPPEGVRPGKEREGPGGSGGRSVDGDGLQQRRPRRLRGVQAVPGAVHTVVVQLDRHVVTGGGLLVVPAVRA